MGNRMDFYWDNQLIYETDLSNKKAETVVQSTRMKIPLNLAVVKYEDIYPIIANNITGIAALSLCQLNEYLTKKLIYS